MLPVLRNASGAALSPRDCRDIPIATAYCECVSHEQQNLENIIKVSVFAKLSKIYNYSGIAISAARHGPVYFFRYLVGAAYTYYVEPNILIW